MNPRTVAIPLSLAALAGAGYYIADFDPATPYATELVVVDGEHRYHVLQITPVSADDAGLPEGVRVVSGPAPAPGAATGQWVCEMVEGQFICEGEPPWACACSARGAPPGQPACEAYVQRMDQPAAWEAAPRGVNLTAGKWRGGCQRAPCIEALDVGPAGYAWPLPCRGEP